MALSKGTMNPVMAAVIPSRKRRQNLLSMSEVFRVLIVTTIKPLKSVMLLASANIKKTWLRNAGKSTLGL
jgi:hypothetical protein